MSNCTECNLDVDDILDGLIEGTDIEIFVFSDDKRTTFMCSNCLGKKGEPDEDSGDKGTTL
jgi:hypothetical protein